LHSFPLQQAFACYKITGSKGISQPGRGNWRGFDGNPRESLYFDLALPVQRPPVLKETGSILFSYKRRIPLERHAMDLQAWIRILACTCFIGSFTQAGASKDLPGTKETESKDYSIKVTVDEVQLDAVVLDGSGHQIVDLTADDFQIYQDGKLQKTISTIYIPDDRRSKKDSHLSTKSNPMLKNAKVRQVIVFIIDDLKMTYESLHFARMAIRKFVETQMQPGDLVSILRIGEGTSASQMFCSDKTQLLSIVDHMRWGRTMYIGGLNARVVKTTGIAKPDPFWGLVMNASKGNPQFMQGGQVTVLEFQISIIQYCIRALQEMSGRKSIFFISPNTMMPGNLDKRSLATLNTLSDEALRSGVVIHTLDLSLEDIIFRKDLPFSKITGGVFLKGPSFWHSDTGIGKANELLKGYYLLSYIPPEDTFFDDEKPSNFKGYHKIKIKVKRGHAYHRDGFYGYSYEDRGGGSSFLPRAPSLKEALYSPFRYADLNVNLASGYAYTPGEGYLIRSWLHVDAKGLTFVDKKDGSHQVSIEVASVIGGSRSMDHSSKGLRCDIAIKNEDLPLAEQNGFDFSIDLPFADHQPFYEQNIRLPEGGSVVPDFISKQTGSAYYVRTAVRDLISKKAGSAYQVMDIPDLKYPQLALSSIFIINKNEDLAKIMPGSANDLQSKPVFDPKTARRSPALRSYLPGEGFDYVLFAYHGKTKNSAAPELESQIVLFKDGQEYFRGPMENVELQGTGNLDRIPIVKRMNCDKAMEPGDYVLQFMIRDKKPEKNKRAAAQATDFQIRKETP
jgi:VWFA-related protein